MFELLKKIILFSLKVLFVAYIFVLLEEVLNSFIFWIRDTLKGISSEERENKKMEQYYKEHGIHCPTCDKWYPISFEYCPLCYNRLSYLDTVNKRLGQRNAKQLQ